MVELREVTLLAVAMRIATAMLVGCVIGLERGLKRRAAGMRTYMLVCVGACLVMLTNQYIYQLVQSGDPMRMGAQVVSGIGFLGAGTIIVTRSNQIRGLTTAAGLWAAAGIGLALGIGFYEAALVASLAVVITLLVMNRFDKRLHGQTRVIYLHVFLGETITLEEFLKAVQAMDIEVKSLQLEYDSGAPDHVRVFDTDLRVNRRQNHVDVVEKLRRIPGVIHLEET